MMKALKFLGNIVLTAVIGFSMLSCPTDDNGGNGGNGDNQQPGDEGKPDIFIVNIGEETEWDWFAAAIDGSCMVFNVDETTGLPTRLFLKPYKDSDDGFSYTFKENGLVDTMVNNGLVFVFDNFKGYTFDFAVIYPDDTTEVHFGIQTEVEWDADNAVYMSGRSVGARSALDTLGKCLEVIGHGIGIVTCATAFTNPASATGCIIYCGSLIAKSTVTVLDALDVLDDWEAGASNLTIDGINLIIDSIGCAGKDVKDCISAVTGLTSMLIGDDLQVVVDKVKQIYEAKEEMTPPPSYSVVNFHANGGSGAVPATRRVETGTTITLPSEEGLSRDGYFFIGWSTSPNGSIRNNAGYTFKVEGNTSFYAQWRENLPAPTGLTATSGSSDSITLSWSEVSGADGYNVYRSTSESGTYLKEGTLNGSASTLILDDGLSANTRYYYKVSYYRNNYGESLLSGSVNAVTMPPGSGIPVIFTGLTANGSVLTNTTALTITFSAAITGLSANDITLAGVEGIQRGTLSGSGPTYTLGISGFSEGGTVSVAVLKSGYNIHESVQSTTIYYCEQGKGLGTYEMVYVQGGTFQLGKDLGTRINGDVEPVSNVTLSSFYIGKYQVTQSQWYAVTGSLPSDLTSIGNIYGRGDAYPIFYVTWYNALVFCNRLSIIEGLSPAYRIADSTNPGDWGTDVTVWVNVTIDSGSNGYRLPTEAQWEYAAKGGNPLASGWVGYTYAGSNTADDVAWYGPNSGSRSHEVGTKAPNGLGLYDMSGNLYELCWDWKGNYTNEDKTDPMGPSSGDRRVTRGGYWGVTYQDIICSVYRPIGENPSYAFNNNGLRVVRPAQ